MSNFLENRKVHTFVDKPPPTEQERLEEIHLETSHIDRAVVPLLVTFTLVFEGRQNVPAFIKGLTEAITSNPSFVRFRSKYNMETNRWTTIPDWNAGQHSICHKDNENNRTLQEAERKSMELIQNMGLSNGKAWLCHFTYNSVSNETTFRWILNHALGDGYAIRSVLLSLLDHSKCRKHPNPKIPFGIKLLRPYYDVRAFLQVRAFQKSLTTGTEQAPSKPAASTDPVVPIDFPGISITKIKAYGKQHGGTMQDVLIHLVALTKKKLGEDAWLSVAFNQRGRQQLDRMDNIINPLPVYLGDKGDLSTIHRSTNTLKGSTLSTYKGYELRNRMQGQKKKAVIGTLPQDRIICLTNMCGVLGANETVCGHKIVSMRFYAHRGEVFSFISNGPVLYPTFTVHQSKRAGRGKLVQETLMDVVRELNLFL